MLNKNHIKGVLHHINSQKHYHLHRKQPNEALSPFIEWYWMVEWDLRNQKPHTQENLPDPSVNITFENNSTQLYGPIKKRFTHTLAKQGRIFGIKFNTGGFYSLTKQNQSQLCDTKHNLASYLKNTSLELLLELSIDTNHTIERNSQIIDQFFSENLFNPNSTLFIQDIEQQLTQLNLINKIISLVKTNQQITTVNTVCQKLGISQRNLQRLCQRYIGLSPKWLIRKFRMQEILARLEHQAEIKFDWQTFISDLGYTDQSHFIHDFKLFTGYTPKQYTERL